MKILQAHNRHASRGGADVVMDQDRGLLTSAGHEVLQLVTEAAKDADLRSAARSVWNQDTVRRDERPDAAAIAAAVRRLLAP